MEELKMPFKYNEDITLIQAEQFPHPSDNYLYVVLGTMDKGNGRIEHVTWEYNTDLKCLTHGHYAKDEESAKIEFTERLKKLSN